MLASINKAMAEAAVLLCALSCAAPGQHRASPGPKSYYAIRSSQAAAERMILGPPPQGLGKNRLRAW
jgi:hypothetical protein